MELSIMLKALGDPTRLFIYRQLLARKHCTRSLSRLLGISESAVSQHLKVLREAGMVTREKYGYHTHYLPVEEALDELVARGMARAREDLVGEGLVEARATDDIAAHEAALGDEVSRPGARRQHVAIDAPEHLAQRGLAVFYEVPVHAHHPRIDCG